jgi:hypothetical protein
MGLCHDIAFTNLGFIMTLLRMYLQYPDWLWDLNKPSPELDELDPKQDKVRLSYKDSRLVTNPCPKGTCRFRCSD